MIAINAGLCKPNPYIYTSKIIAMPQSLVKNYLHIVFSTKNRAHIIDSNIEKALHQYLGGICKSMECLPLKVGGYTNHIHILCMLSKKIALVNLMQELKSSSSAWVKKQDDKYRNFYWQDGYGAFSVNPSQVETVLAYIESQHEHHRKKTFEDEYRAFLRKYNMAIDERYVWD